MSKELRPNVDISIVYNFTTHKEYLTIKFPLGPNHDLHVFLQQKGSKFMRFFRNNSKGLVLYVQHDIPKENVMSIVQSQILDELANAKDDIDVLLDEIEKLARER